jgi:hypothetical protein
VKKRVGSQQFARNKGVLDRILIFLTNGGISHLPTVHHQQEAHGCFTLRKCQPDYDWGDPEKILSKKTLLTSSIQRQKPLNYRLKTQEITQIEQSKSYQPNQKATIFKSNNRPVSYSQKSQVEQMKQTKQTQQQTSISEDFLATKLRRTTLPQKLSANVKSNHIINSTLADTKRSTQSKNVKNKKFELYSKHKSSVKTLGLLSSSNSSDAHSIGNDSSRQSVTLNQRIHHTPKKCQPQQFSLAQNPRFLSRNPHDQNQLQTRHFPRVNRQIVIAKTSVVDTFHNECDPLAPQTEHLQQSRFQRLSAENPSRSSPFQQKESPTDRLEVSEKKFRLKQTQNIPHNVLNVSQTHCKPRQDHALNSPQKYKFRQKSADICSEPQQTTLHPSDEPRRTPVPLNHEEFANFKRPQPAQLSSKLLNHFFAEERVSQLMNHSTFASRTHTERLKNLQHTKSATQKPTRSFIYNPRLGPLPTKQKTENERKLHTHLRIQTQHKHFRENRAGILP